MLLTCEEHGGVFIYESHYSHSACPVCEDAEQLEVAEKERDEHKADSERFEEEVGELTDQIHELQKQLDAKE